MSKSTALLTGASVGALAVVLTRPINGNGKSSLDKPTARQVLAKIVSQPKGATKMKAVFQVLNDDGTQAMDSVTGEPHAFDFPIAPEAYAMIEGWMAGQTITNEAGESVPKWRNMGYLAAQILYGSFRSMAPPAATADLVAAQKAAADAAEARFAAMFGVVA